MNLQRQAFSFGFILALIAPLGAHAGPSNLAEMTTGYTYYNRIGASIADHDLAVKACAAEAFKSHSVDSQMPASGLMGFMILGSLANAANRGVFAAALENCMVVKGWRVVRLPEMAGKDLAALPAAALAQRLEPWVGAETPQGDVVRVWANDAANGTTVRYAVRPQHQNDGLLSLKSATGSPLETVTLPDQPPPPKIELDPKWPTRGLKPNQIAAAPPETGVLVVELKGVSGKAGIGLVFTRQGEDKDSKPSIKDHAPDYVSFMAGLFIAKREGNFFAIGVPPGRWRIAAMGAMPSLNFCLGAPSFELKAGEVVYAGAFDLSAEDIGPDLTLGAPKAWLAGQPASDKVRAAVYTNGSLGQCGDNGLYALEIKGAPFEPDYHWGSKAVVK